MAYRSQQTTDQLKQEVKILHKNNTIPKEKNNQQKDFSPKKDLFNKRQKRISKTIT